MNATELKDILRRRHPAVGTDEMLGSWTVLEEWMEIDLLALSATKVASGAQRRSHYPRVGYEVKVSRADLRRELLDPRKRANALAVCHEFYFAVPEDLLKEEEIAYAEPEWRWPQDFRRAPCPERCHPPDRHTRRRRGIRGHGRWEAVSTALGSSASRLEEWRRALRSGAAARNTTPRQSDTSPAATPGEHVRHARGAAMSLNHGSSVRRRRSGSPPMSVWSR